MTVHADATVWLDCVPPEGYPTPTVQWLRNGDPLRVRMHASNGSVLEADRQLAASRIPYGQYPNGTLVLYRAQGAQSGRYNCRASNSLGKRTSDYATITIIGKLPVLKHEPEVVLCNCISLNIARIGHYVLNIGRYVM